jgi:tetratricopeptide (TPR) repeat protein
VISSKRRLTTVAGAIALIALMGTAAGMQLWRERRFPEAEPAEEILYVASPRVLTRLALSYKAVLADIYWIRAIQYYGSRRLLQAPVKRYDLLYPLLDLTTSLDPDFSIAYRFGAYFLSEAAPSGAGRPDLAVDLLQKGMSARPTRWEYPYDVAFVHFRLGDFRSAGEWFRRAGQIPGAPNWLEPMAAVTLARGGDRQTSRAILQRLYASSDIKWLKDSAAWRLQQLDALDAIDALQQITAEYARRYGRPPADWQTLVRAGLLRGVPLDPAGVPYVLNPWWGTVAVSKESSLWPMPGELKDP